MEFKELIRALIVGALLASLIFLLHHRGWLEALELKSLDLRFKMRGPLAPQLPIVLVSIDQDSFDELELPWPWPRTLHAELIRKLAHAQAKIIAFDVLFTEPKADPAEDRALAEAIQEAGNIILAAEYTEVPSDFGPRTSLSLPIPLLRKAALGYGFANLVTDNDGILRRGNPALLFQERKFPGLAYRMAEALIGKENLGGDDIPTSPRLINFRGPARSYPIVPYYRILRDEIEPEVFRDKLVLVGAFSPSLHDIFPTPFSASRPTAGVEIQANFVETLVADDSIRPISASSHAALFFLLSAGTIWVAIRFTPLRATATVFVVTALFAFAALYVFSHHELWAPMVPSILATTLCFSGITVDNYLREQKKRLRMRAMLNRYVSPDVAAELLKHPEGLTLSGKRTHLTVLFSDIRGFTGISEQIAPEQVVSLLSDYLAQVSRLVFKNKGTIDKFIGDAVFAIFGWPQSYGDDAARAVKTGIEMIELVESLGPKWAQVIGRPLKIGVGVNTGEAVVGNIGSEIRSDVTAIGDTVNLGARLESLTKELGVPMLISEYTAAEIKDSIPLRPLRQVKVVGRETPILVYCPEQLLEGDVEFALDSAKPYVQRDKG